MLHLSPVRSIGLVSAGVALLLTVVTAFALGRHEGVFRRESAAPLKHGFITLLAVGSAFLMAGPFAGPCACGRLVVGLIFGSLAGFMILMAWTDGRAYYQVYGEPWEGDRILAFISLVPVTALTAPYWLGAAAALSVIFWTRAYSLLLNLLLATGWTGFFMLVTAMVWLIAGSTQEGQWMYYDGKKFRPGGPATVWEVADHLVLGCSVKTALILTGLVSMPLHLWFSMSAFRRGELYLLFWKYWAPLLEIFS